jgi:3-isopropylmalate/(R)-2-methylmalate dehydratase small subunit
VDEIFNMVAGHSGLTATVDLPAQHIVFHAPSPRRFDFEIDAGAREQLLGGLDDIDLTIGYEADISRFEAQYNPLNPHS